ncbi:DUF5994 family protein [Streptomyces spinoverrucosus]|uniref:DUF5994 family protein n=1 Tax=Streptomyces spinoverrucosus TaxID=284043 RepID=UPI003570E1AC
MPPTTSHSRYGPFPRAPAVRLALKSQSPADGRAELDGAWWPRSRDLESELSTGRSSHPGSSSTTM